MIILPKKQLPPKKIPSTISQKETDVTVLWLLQKKKKVVSTIKTTSSLMKLARVSTIQINKGYRKFEQLRKW